MRKKKVLKLLTTLLVALPEILRLISQLQKQNEAKHFDREIKKKIDDLSKNFDIKDINQANEKLNAETSR